MKPVASVMAASDSANWVGAAVATGDAGQQGGHQRVPAAFLHAVGTAREQQHEGGRGDVGHGRVQADFHGVLHAGQRAAWAARS